MSDTKTLPKRLHHTAYVTKDLEATRAFYEDLIGLPLTATWSEQDELFGEVAVIIEALTQDSTPSWWDTSSL